MTTQTQAPEQADQDQTTTPEPTTPTTAKVRRPSFRKEEPQPNPSDLSPELGPGDSSEAGDGFPGPSEQMPDEPSTRSGSSRTSSRAERKALQQAVAAGFAGATMTAHTFLVRDPYAKYVELLIPDEEDVQAVSEPAGNLISRRLGDVPLGSDLGDVVELLVAAAGYVMKQFTKLSVARQLRNGGGVVGDGLQPDATHGQGGEDQAGPPAYDVPLAD